MIRVDGFQPLRAVVRPVSQKSLCTVASVTLFHMTLLFDRNEISGQDCDYLLGLSERVAWLTMATCVVVLPPTTTAVPCVRLKAETTTEKV